MTDPYKILGLETSASEAEIRKRYLELVKVHTPDRDPERFAEIRQAYEAVREPLVRLEALLFETQTADSLPQLAKELRSQLGRTRLPFKTLLALAEIK